MTFLLINAGQRFNWLGIGKQLSLKLATKAGATMLGISIVRPKNISFIFKHLINKHFHPLSFQVNILQRSRP